MRTRARELGIRIPDFCPLFNHDDVRAFLARVPGPWLIKPRSEASAAGIRKLHTADEVWKRIDELGDDQSFCLIERMVPGDLYHVDSLTADGKVIFAEVNAYWRPLARRVQGGGVYADPHVPARPAGGGRPPRGERAGAGGVRAGVGRVAHRVHAGPRRRRGLLHRDQRPRRRGEHAELVEHATGVNLWSEVGEAGTEPRHQ
jgi:hypothetical protein